MTRPGRIDARIQQRTQPRQTPLQLSLGRAALILLPLTALVAVWAILSRPVIPPSAGPLVTVHTVTPDCVSAQDMARAYGWSGDWREYAWQIRQLNPGLDWGRLHAGQQLLVPDHRHSVGQERVSCPGQSYECPSQQREGVPGDVSRRRSARATRHPATARPRLLQIVVELRTGRGWDSSPGHHTAARSSHPFPESRHGSGPPPSSSTRRAGACLLPRQESP